jgi:magnesium transporter
MLVNCVAYENGIKIADLDIPHVKQHLEKFPNAFVWVAIKDPTEEELAQLENEFDLHSLAIEDARNGHQRPKVEEYEDTLFSVIQLLDKREDEILVGEVAIFVNKRFILSIRSRSEQNFLGVRNRCEQEPELLKHGPGFVYYAIMDNVVDRYFQIIDELETELDAIETSIFEKNSARESIERLFALKLKTMTIKHAALPMLEFIGKLHGGRVPPVCQESQEYFRDVHDHLSLIVSSLESVREAISTAIQVNFSLVTIEESEVTKKLASWAAIFGASTMLAGIWGMNFENMPELKWEWGYALALASIGSVSIALFIRFRKAGWL